MCLVELILKVNWKVKHGSGRPPTWACSMMENMPSESVLDWFLRSCQLAQGSAGCRSNICPQSHALLITGAWVQIL